MIVAMHLILFLFGRVIGHRLPVDFHQPLVVGSTAVAVAVSVCPARSRLVAVVIVIMIVVSVAVAGHLRESRLSLPTVQCRREGHRVDLDVLPVLLREYRVGNTRRGEYRPAYTSTIVINNLYHTHNNVMYI